MTILANLTERVATGHELAADEVAQAVGALLDETLPVESKAHLLTELARRGESAAEIAAFAAELRRRAIDPGIDPTDFGGVLLDVCGTGADMANTFNISTGVMFVVAAAGVPVVKHGNRAITSKCGSADVLAALGARIELSPAGAQHCLRETGATFFFAPHYHPVFKQIAPVRKLLAERKQRTVFNVLGPLVNPARPTHQVVGIFDRALVPTYAEVLRRLGVQRAFVVHGDGLDEFSIMGVNTVAELWAGRIELTERDFHVPHTEPRVIAVKREELAGGDPVYSAQLLRDIFSGKNRGPCRDIVLLNAAGALVCAERADDFLHGWRKAAELIDSGAAAGCLEKFVAVTQQST